MSKRIDIAHFPPWSADHGRRNTANPFPSQQSRSRTARRTRVFDDCSIRATACSGGKGDEATDRHGNTLG